MLLFILLLSSISNDLYIFDSFLVIHGGLWVDRDKSQYENIGATLSERGLSVAVINYRKSKRDSTEGEFVHPIHIFDFLDSLRYPFPPLLPSPLLLPICLPPSLFFYYHPSLSSSFPTSPSLLSPFPSRFPAHLPLYISFLSLPTSPFATRSFITPIYLYENKSNYPYDLNNLYFLGHSCGAHIASLPFLARSKYLKTDRFVPKGIITVQVLLPLLLFFLLYPFFFSSFVVFYFFILIFPLRFFVLFYFFLNFILFCFILIISI